jgi:hypothetical protein
MPVRNDVLCAERQEISILKWCSKPCCCWLHKSRRAHTVAQWGRCHGNAFVGNLVSISSLKTGSLLLLMLGHGLGRDDTRAVDVDLAASRACPGGPDQLQLSQSRHAPTLLAPVLEFTWIASISSSRCISTSCVHCLGLNVIMLRPQLAPAVVACHSLASWLHGRENSTGLLERAHR